MQKIFRILLYLSLIFFIWYLYRADYLVFRDISFDAVKLSASMLILFAGFLVTCISWNQALRVSGKRVKFSDAVISHGKFIFSKYIPGKFWVILGRASHFSPHKKSLRLLSLVSLQEQLLFVWWGLVLSLPPTFFVSRKPWVALIILAAIVLLAFTFFNGWFHSRFSGLLSRLFKRDFDFRPMKISFFLRVSAPVFLFWLLWSAGFWFLMLSMYDNIPPLLALAFPAGITYGFVVIFMPAGIGVREGIVASFLIAGGISSANAVTISVISRFWFVAGEVFLFMLSRVLQLTGKQGGPQ